MRAAAPALLALLAGCSLITDSFVTNEFSGDPFPIQVDLASGAVVVGVRAQGGPDLVGVIDLLSPITLVDPGPTSAPAVASADLTILGQRTPGGPLDLPRARLQGATILNLHPCKDDPCTVGAEPDVMAYDAVIGADSLAGDAIRLRLGDAQVFILADDGGTERERTHACDAVFPTPYRGGGTLVIAGTERPFAGRRIALPTCLGANPDPLLPQGERGADALMVVSTSLGTTILGESAYARYRLSHPTAPDLATLPESSVQLPSGPIVGRRGVIDNLALVASSSQTPRAPCRQVYGSHFLVTRNCVTGDDCPCEAGNQFCPIPSVLELAPPTGVGVLIVPDSTPTLQALRVELRPNQAEVDGIIGTDVLRSAELDADYPHNRVLARCTGEGCQVRPQLSDEAERTQVQGCIPANPTGPIF